MAAKDPARQRSTLVNTGSYKLGTMIKVSEELLNDNVFNLESYISREFARRIGAKEEKAFFTGNGMGRPLGVLAVTGGAQTGVTAASATAITADEIMDLFYALKAPYRKKAVWVLNDSTIKAIRKLKDSNGQYLWQPSITAGTPERAVIMLSSHFYESRDGSTGGFFADNTDAARQVWDTVNPLLRLDRDWQV